MEPSAAAAAETTPLFLVPIFMSKCETGVPELQYYGGKNKSNSMLMPKKKKEILYRHYIST